MQGKRELAQEIISKHTYIAVGTGLIPIPLVDIVILSTVQANMISELCDAYKVSYEKSIDKVLMTSVAGGALPKFAGSLIKAVPGIGSLIGGIFRAGFSAASTYAIGEVFVRHFEEGGNMKNFNFYLFQDYYQEVLEKGKAYVEATQKKSRNGDFKMYEINNEVTEELKRLNLMLDQGEITEEQFSELTDQLLDSL
ncbi:MAG: DUF697 domain-containing protein [Chitinophagales bacterium]